MDLREGGPEVLIHTQLASCLLPSSSIMACFMYIVSWFRTPHLSLPQNTCLPTLQLGKGIGPSFKQAFSEPQLLVAAAARRRWFLCSARVQNVRRSCRQTSSRYFPRRFRCLLRRSRHRLHHFRFPIRRLRFPIRRLRSLLHDLHCPIRRFYRSFRRLRCSFLRFRCPDEHPWRCFR